MLLLTLITIVLAAWNKTDILNELTKSFILAIGAFGGGYGFARWRGQKGD
jgi:hypothetical protein